MNLYDAFPELAAIILDWWEAGAISILIIGLFINFFFTMHKGKRYRVAFVLLLVTLLTLLYVDVITPADRHIQADDMIRPIMYSCWAYTAWTRAWIYLAYFTQLKGQYEATIEQVLSAENAVVPWKEVALYGMEMEKWQNWVTRTIALVFAVGLLYSNVDKIESLQRVSIQSNQMAAKKDQQSKQDALRAKHYADSLFLVQIVNERERTEMLLSRIDETKENSVTNKNLLLSERRRNQQLLQYLKGIEESLKSRLDPIPTIKPKSSNWGKSLSPDRVGNPRYPKNNTFSSAESDPDTTHYARANVY